MHSPAGGSNLQPRRMVGTRSPARNLDAYITPMLMSERVRPRCSGFVGVTFGEILADALESATASATLACLAFAGVPFSSPAAAVDGGVLVATPLAVADVGLLAAVPVGECVMKASIRPASVLRFAISREVCVRHGNLRYIHEDSVCCKPTRGDLAGNELKPRTDARAVEHR